ncbi:uncharacterized protein LOC129613890 isoform X2 [Condylostylus longicornis]|uniref:uncharacterized protein LOC129613890 isoform X2 n=1 Tax=Condylostylus longicornis TaxID=2530218 RepID=UPI00244DA472|nr:uncharacterized protein LOC129613890 isoform X2 [Condylostylus longicornis]
MYGKPKNSMKKKKSQIFFEHDDRFKKTKPKMKNKNFICNMKKYKYMNQRNKKITKDRVLNYGKQNIIMCYCNCSISQLQTNTSYCCATNTHQKNCGFEIPVNWKFFQSRCQCRFCEINFFKNFKRSQSPLEIEKQYQQESYSTKRTSRVTEMFTPPSPVHSSRKKPLELEKKHTKLRSNSHLDSTDKQTFADIIEEKVTDSILSKKNKKKKKKRHKKRKYRSSKFDKSEENGKRKKFRKGKKSKKNIDSADEFCPSKSSYILANFRSSPSKKVLENIKEDGCRKSKELSVTNKKKKDYEKYISSPDDRCDGKLTPVLLNNIKVDEKPNIGLNTQPYKLSRSPSSQRSPILSVNCINSESKTNISFQTSLNEVKYFGKHQKFENKTINSTEIKALCNSRKNYKTCSVSAPDNLNMRVSTSFNDENAFNEFQTIGRSQYNKMNNIACLEFYEEKEKKSNSLNLYNNDVNCKSQKHLHSTKVATTSLEGIKSAKYNGNDRRYDNYNENTISGKDLDSYVNAIMVDEYKEKKLNDFELLNELKNNIAIKAREKIKSIEKVSNKTFFTVPSVNKFISGISSSPESRKGYYSNLSTFHMKEAKNSGELFQSNSQTVDENIKVSDKLQAGEPTTTELRELNDSNKEKLLDVNVKPSSSYSRSKSRYSTESSANSSRSNYSYSSGRTSHSYSRSSSRCSSSLSRSRSRSRNHSRSPSIPRRRGSPSFLERRRITSARKRPVPYNRVGRSSVSQTGQAVCNIYTTILKRTLSSD